MSIDSDHLFNVIVLLVPPDLAVMLMADALSKRADCLQDEGMRLLANDLRVAVNRSVDRAKAAAAIPEAEKTDALRTWLSERGRIGCQCGQSDAWRCAVEKRLCGRIACDCECHRYLTKRGNG